jgi:hypothetical protein
MSLFSLSIGVANNMEKFHQNVFGVVLVMSSTFIWLASLRCVLQFLKQGWGTVIYFHSTEHFWRSGIGVMFMKYMPYGRWLLIVNMAACVMVGVLMMLAWGFGRILGRGWGNFFYSL